MMKCYRNVPPKRHINTIHGIILYTIITLILFLIVAFIFIIVIINVKVMTHYDLYDFDSQSVTTTPFTCSAVCNCIKASAITILPILTINAISRHGAYDSARNKFDKQCECLLEDIKCDDFVRIIYEGICDYDGHQRKDECRLLTLQYILILDEQHMEYDKDRVDEDMELSYILQEYDYDFKDDLINFCSKNNCRSIWYESYNSDKRCEYKW